MPDPRQPVEQQLERWRRKYYDSLEELERKERQWQEVEEVLRQAVSRLTLAVDPTVPELVRKADTLRGYLREGTETLRLRRALAELGEDIVRLDEARRGGAAPVRPADVLEHLLDELRPPRGARKALRQARQAIARQAEGGDPVRLAAEVARAINSLLAEASGTEGERGGLLARLFQRDEDTGAPPPPPSPEPAAAGPAEREPPPAEPAAPASPVDAPAAAAEPDELPRPASLAAGAEVLVQLIERLSLPEDLSEKAETVKAGLAGEVSWVALGKAVADTADLVAVMRGRLEAEKMELEAFLKQLTEGLREIDAGLQDTARLHADSHEEGSRLNDAVGREVGTIEDALAGGDLAGIKAAVQASLHNIRSHMEAFRTSQAQRAERAEQQLDELKQRLSSMERETEQLRSQLETEHRRALRDPLTGVPNRLAYMDRIQAELARADRYGNPLCLMVWDVDHFKQVNDRYGHQAGDKVLRVLAQTLVRRMRASDFIARYGGEEFVVLLPETRLDDARRIAEDLRETVAGLDFHYRQEPVPITASCGLTEYRKGDVPESIFARADGALYRAKEAGRNRCEVG